jgi:hypothetical protein
MQQQPHSRVFTKSRSIAWFSIILLLLSSYATIFLLPNGFSSQASDGLFKYLLFGSGTLFLLTLTRLIKVEPVRFASRLILGVISAIFLIPCSFIIVMIAFDSVRTSMFVTKELKKHDFIKNWYFYGYADEDMLWDGFELGINFENSSVQLWSTKPSNFRYSDQIYLTSASHEGKVIQPRLLAINKGGFYCGPSNVLNLTSPPVKDFLSVERFENIHDLINKHKIVLNKLSEVPVIKQSEVTKGGGIFLKDYCPNNDALLFIEDVKKDSE